MALKLIERLLQRGFAKKQFPMKFIQPALREAPQGIVCEEAGDVPGAGELGEALFGKWKQHQLGAAEAD